MLRYHLIPVTPFQQNCTLLWCNQSKEAVLIDCGGEPDKIKSLVDANGLTIKQIWLTHGHIDHVGAAPVLAEDYQVPIYGPHSDDQFWLAQLPWQSRQTAFPETVAFTPDRWLQAGDQLQLGQWIFQVLHCPGHTPGHLAFYQAEQQLAWVGDILFHNSIGRTDFPQGSQQQLLTSIKQQLLPLGDDVHFIPGHGPMSTFGQERQHNPFLQE